MFVSLKAHSIPGVVDAMQPLLGKETSVVTAVNGVPYWYFYKHGGHLENSTLETVDPGGKQWASLLPERAIGCIVYPATEVVEPGVVQHVYGDKFPLGRAERGDDRAGGRVQQGDGGGGMRAPVLDKIRGRDVAQAVGQSELQPDQRADGGDART